MADNDSKPMQLDNRTEIPSWSDPFPDHPKWLGDNVRKIVDDLRSNGALLDKAYQEIDSRASADLRINGQDFLLPEHIFNENEKGRDKLRLLEFFHDNDLVRCLFAKITKHDLPLITPEIHLYEKMRKVDDEFSYQATDMKPLNNAFKQKYLSSTHKKNTSLNPKTNTEQDLLTDLLNHNPGFALGDIHISAEAEKLLIRNMATLKANHVDTIYVEAPYALELKDLSANELKQLAREGNFGNTTLVDARLWGDCYGVAHSDDVPRAIIQMMAAAKENGIRVVYMDKEGPAREREVILISLAHRIESDNFVWTDFIMKDRKDKAPDSKYVVWGGLGHFINVGFVEGMVSKALGIPLLAFKKADKATEPVFAKSNDATGVDFWLAGGNDYFDVLKRFLTPPLPSTSPTTVPATRPMAVPRRISPHSPYHS